jgi:hypothetical protein
MNLVYTARSVRAESLKLKRSLALSAALLVPLFPSFANFASALQSHIGRMPEDPAYLSMWSLYFRYSIKLWTIFAMPVVVALLRALLGAVDVKGKGWKHMFAMGVPQSAVFAGKWFSLAGLSLVSTLVFASANWPAAWRPTTCAPTWVGFPHPHRRGLRAPAAGLAVVAVHAQPAPMDQPALAGLPVSLAVGFAASVSNLFTISSYLFSSSYFSPGRCRCRPTKTGACRWPCRCWARRWSTPPRGGNSSGGTSIKQRSRNQAAPLFEGHGASKQPAQSFSADKLGVTINPGEINFNIPQINTIRFNKPLVLSYKAARITVSLLPVAPLNWSGGPFFPLFRPETARLGHFQPAGLNFEPFGVFFLIQSLFSTT